MASPPTPLQRIDRPRLAELAAERIGEWIVASDLKPGDRLPSEQGLMEALGLGRSVIREALAKLKVLGVVTTHQGRGAFVADLPFELLRNRLRRVSGQLQDPARQLEWIWEIREILEVAIVERAATRRSDEELRDLEVAVRDMDRAIDGGGDAVEEDAMFHHHLTRAAHNPLLEQLMEDVSILIERSRRDSLSRPGRPASSNEEHRTILDAIRRGDVTAAGEAMHQHLINGRRLDGTSASDSGQGDAG
ncbi:MAG TPA: FadR/GntR family transcriptional regulator [Gammaproteobacteria bacterium]|nr:FadR/GntR family transcriptional regulator [Gammaproteobacteria bacterium]